MKYLICQFVSLSLCSSLNPCKYPDKYPAICHVDNTSRVQTVSKEDNISYYNLIKRFYKETGCPMVLNTSLNIKGQPIVNDEKRRTRF